MTFPVDDSGPSDADAGHTVVLLHGFPETRASWQDVAARLNNAGLRTLAPDLRGLPASARPRRRRDYRVERLVEDVHALLDAAGLPSANLVGHDWGGGVAWEAALRRPDRVRSLTALTTPHPSAMLWSLARSAQGLRSWYMLAVQVPRLPEALFAITGALAPYRALLLWPSPHTTRSHGAVAVPTTYVWSRHDPYLGPRAARRTAHYCTGPYRFVEADADHWLPEKHPDLVADVVLDRVAG